MRSVVQSLAEAVDGSLSLTFHPPVQCCHAGQNPGRLILIDKRLHRSWNGTIHYSDKPSIELFSARNTNSQSMCAGRFIISLGFWMVCLSVLVFTYFLQCAKLPTPSLKVNIYRLKTQAICATKQCVYDFNNELPYQIPVCNIKQHNRRFCKGPITGSQVPNSCSRSYVKIKSIPF